MIYVNDNNYNNTIYNEGKISKNEKKSFLSFIGGDIPKTNSRISKENTGFLDSKNELLMNISAISHSDIDNAAKIQALRGVLSGYNVPSVCLYALAANKGEMSLNGSNKLSFSMNITGINIGKIYNFNWNEDGEKSLVCTRANGSSIMQLDEDEINDLFKYVDEHNNNVKELIEEESEKRLKNEEDYDDIVG